MNTRSLPPTHTVRPELVEGLYFCFPPSMPFWAYMLHCADRSFYVGHTDDLELRLAQHEQGTFGGYTATRHPLKLVWCGEFPTRYEALSAERQIKGWSRAKKLALIREDWPKISMLAKNREKGRASTGSARTVEGMSALTQPVSPFPPPHSVRPEPVEGPSFLGWHALKPHPDSSSPPAIRIAVEISRPAPAGLHLRYLVTGAIDDLLLAPETAPARTDGLWNHTCFEAFIREPSKSGYCEFNFSPSTQWAAYAFDAYREGMRAAATEPPDTETRLDGNSFELSAHFTPGLDTNLPWQLALSAVIEQKNGSKSWWALAHPGAKPDFHHPDSFTLELPAADTP